MAIVGEAYVVVKAITTGFNRQIQQSLNGLDADGTRAGENIGRSFSNGAAKGLSAADREAQNVYQGVNRLVETSYYLQSAAVAAAQGISVLASGLFALGSQIAAATPSLIVLPSLFSAIAQGGIAAKIAFGGIGEALSGLNKKKSGTAAFDKMPGLYEALARAEERVAAAKRKSISIEGILTQARIDAKESAQQLKFASEDAALGEKRAAINLEKARKTLARVQDLPPNSTARKEAELSYQEAELAYRKAKDSNSDLDKAVKKSNEEGIKGSKEVKAAKETIADADREAKHAADELAKADKAVKDEKKKKASGGGGTDPLAGLGKSAKTFVEYLAKLKPLLDEIKIGIQDTLFPKLQTALETLVKSGVFKTLKEKLADTGSAIGDAAIDFAKLFSDPVNLKNFSDVLDTNNRTIKKMGTVTGNLVTSFITLLDAASPLVDRFTDWLVTLTGGWKETLNTKNATDDLTKVFDSAGDVAAQLGDIIGNVFDALMNMGKAASGPGSGGQLIFDFLEKATGKFKEFTGGALKDGSLEKFFKSTSENFIKLLEIIGIVVGAILKTGDDPGVSKFFDSLKNAVQTLADALVHLSESGISEAFGKFIEGFAKFTAQTMESGSIKMYFGILNKALGFLVTIMSNPAFQKMFVVLASIHGARLAFGRMGKAVNLVNKYIKGDIDSFKNLADRLRMMPGRISSMATPLKNMAGNFKAARAMNMGFFSSLKMTLQYTKLGTIATKIASGATKAWAATTAALSAAMEANPVGMIVLAIMALVAILTIAYFKFEWFRNFVDSVWDAIAAALSLVYNTVIKPIFELMLSVFKIAWDGIKAAFTVVWDIIKAAIELYWNFYMKPIFELMLTVFKLTWDGIKKTFTVVWDIVKTAISFGWNNIIKPIFEAFGKIFGAVWDGIKTAFSKAWDFITGAIGKAKDVFGGIGDAIKEAFKTAFNFVADIWNKTVGKIGFTVPDWVPAIGGKEFRVPNIPKLAEGGIIPATRGGMAAIVGEGGRPERVEPLDSQGLSKRDRAIITMLSGGNSGGINITVNPSPGMDEVELAALVSRQISFQLRRGAA